MEEKMPNKKQTIKKMDTERTFIKGLGFCGNGVDGNLTAVDVKNGKIVRLKPLRYDWKYKPAEFRPWKNT